MKKFTCVSACTIMLSLLFTACKKQVVEPAVSESTMLSESMQATSCKSTVFALYEEGFYTRWVNVMQKWYGNDKVRSINMEFADTRFAYMMYGSEHALRLRLGEVTYEGNQVYVRDQEKDHLVFRATLDESGKALATYYHNKLDNSNQVYAYDTLYYYYTGNRLDSAVQLSKARFNSSNVRHSWEKYIFFYDGLGNLVSIHLVNDNSRLNFVYDYSRPVAGIIPNYRLTIPFRVAEFLDVVKLPMHYVISEVNITEPTADGSYNVITRERFANYAIDDGLVYAYHNAQNDAIFKKSYYTGWDCGSEPVSAVSRQQQSIGSPEQFQQLYPASRK